MSQFVRARYAPVAVALLSIMLLAPFLAWQSAQGGESVAVSKVAPDGIIVVGDSITARYNDKPGDPMQGWWSMLGHQLGAQVTTYAQSGSGYLRPGHDGREGACQGTRFIDRDQVFNGPPPSMVIIEGGRNDWSRCSKGRYVTASDTVIRRAVDTYLDALQTFLPRSTRIIVMGPPWGPQDPLDGLRVTSIVEAAAKQHGLQFVSTSGDLTPSRVLDGKHPNRAGSWAIADSMIHALG